MDMGVCSTCKYYIGVGTAGICDFPDTITGEVAFRAGNGFQINASADDDSGLSCSMKVSPGFGCIQHSEKI